mmetsp:Transcript_57880/g.125129  ORF Transcript_57880/g.125129 Transcript_57880/m.125129 type:complete len:307 (+) Transcript_57880:72-992(+)|eukprot:CAMPEP_0170620682 /NCGR_PEP_ID=MMETSP0224-20130122/28188_1 /TAXON_ID=285029 /ORGANISM="Togula jolla, Strain CCCM 725" /LENGTH=306 /DNA_ID=CAMNT_0010946871 /DNA_START=48 /DNA_END=968 /DNA_ORIENTATION=+
MATSAFDIFDGEEHDVGKGDDYRTSSVLSALRYAPIFPLSLLAFVIYQGATLKPFLTFTDRTPWIWELTGMCYMIKVAHDQRETVKDWYWAHSLLATAVAAFGGGFLAPLVVAHCPVPLVEETYFWMVVAAWYLTHNWNVSSYFLGATVSAPLGRVVFSIFFSIFKTNQIVGGCELAAQALFNEELVPNSRYFNTPWAAPLLCGFLSGCGGGLVLHSEKGLGGGQWAIRASFLAPVLYYSLTRKWEYEPLEAKMIVCVVRIVAEVLTEPRDKIFGFLTAVAYKATGVRRTPAIVVPIKKANPEAEA